MGTSTEKQAHTDLLTDKDRAETDNAEKLIDEEVTDEVPAHPVDRGWAWMILLGAILEVFLYGGLMRSYGVFFLQFQERFGSSASQTTLIQTLLNVFISISGIFVMTYGMKHMTARTSICIGAILTSASYIICAYTTRIEVAIVLLGAVAGATGAMIYLPILGYIAIYFNKRRGLANSLCSSGASVGALALGSFFNIMFEHYGYSGTMLITGGLLLNILVTGCIFRDPSFYNKDKRKTGHRKELESSKMQREALVVDFKDISEEATSVINGNITNGQNYEFDNKCHKSSAKTRPILYKSLSLPMSKDPCGDIHVRSHRATCKNCKLNQWTPWYSKTNTDASTAIFHSENNICIGAESNNKCLRKEYGHYCISSVNALLPSTDIIPGSVITFNTEPLNMHCNKYSATSSETVHRLDNSNCLSITKFQIREFFATVFDKTILLNPVFIHFMCFATFSAPGSILTYIFFVPLAKEIGFNTDQIGILLFVVGLVDLMFKLSAGVIVDRKLLKPTTLISMAFAVGCIVNNLTRVIHSYWQMLGFVIIQSSLTAVYSSLYAVILVEMLGIEKFKGAIGFTNMVVGVSMGAFFPITGVVRDVTGSYHSTYHLLSVLLLFGSVLSYTLPLTHRRYNRRHTGTTAKP